MRLYHALRAVKGIIFTKKAECRKIVSVDTGGQRMAAMTFDDGPCGLTCPDGRTLTDFICDKLASFGFTATFNIIGTTAENYPDRPGKGFLWSGQRYDHYPRFGDDALGGAVNHPQLIKKLLENGNELANHGYRHIVCCRMRYPYYKRGFFNTADEVYADYKKLHDFIYDNYGYTMTGARPPHYVDRLCDGSSVFDIYEKLNYSYYAASYDAGGWSSDDSAEAMVNRLKRTLQKNADALCGAVIFQKDGLSMKGEMLIYDALPKQLEILAEYGYKIVSVKELINKNID